MASRWVSSRSSSGRRKWSSSISSNDQCTRVFIYYQQPTILPICCLPSSQTQGQQYLFSMSISLIHLRSLTSSILSLLAEHILTAFLTSAKHSSSSSHYGSNGKLANGGGYLQIAAYCLHELSIDSIDRGQGHHRHNQNIQALHHNKYSL